MSSTQLTPGVNRFATAYALAWSVGVVLIATDLNARLTAFGLGLLAPGGGLASYGHWPELAAVAAGCAWVVWKREWTLGAYAWFAIAAVSLTHGPHAGQQWEAAAWVVPAATAFPALFCTIRAARRTDVRIRSSAAGQRSSK